MAAAGVMRNGLGASAAAPVHAAEDPTRIALPVIPNTPLAAPEEDMPLAAFALRRNRLNGLVENHAFDPTLLTYDKSYQNNQSVSGVFLDHMRAMYRLIASRYPKGATLVEVGCGKGRFLDLVKAAGHFAYQGYDAAYEGDDPNIHDRYVTAEDRIAADIVVLRHTLEHIRRPHVFLAELRQAFGDADILIEVPDFDWIEQGQVLFDFSYEHVNYFTASALAALFAEHHRQGACFGGQYQYLLAPLRALRPGFADEARSDAHWDAYPLQPFFESFRAQTAALDLPPDGRVWVWGGATKGVLFLHHLQRLDPSLFARIAGVVDANPKKQNGYTASSKLRIRAPEDFARGALDGDSVIVMNPNYAPEITDFIRQNARPFVRVVAF